MKLKDILTKVGPAVLSAVYPPAIPAVAAINALLPSDKKLPDQCTGTQFSDALSLIADPQAKQSLLETEYAHVEAVMGHKASAMNAANSAENENYQVSRAYIAKQSFHVVSAVTLIVVSAWATAVLNHDKETVMAIMQGWPMIVAILVPFVALLHAYMGVLKAEYRDRLNASNGKTAFGAIGALAAALKR